MLVDCCCRSCLLQDFGVYSEFVQHHSTQANYWHDAEDENRYLKGNLWLPKVNGHPFDAMQKSRLTQLNKFVMVKFENDTMVQPRESSWFGFYKKGK